MCESERAMAQHWNRELEVATKAVRAAAEVARGIQAKIGPEALEKKDKSPVTVADYAVQAMICCGLREAFSDDPIIAEEESQSLREPEQRPFLERIAAEIGSSQDDVLAWIDRGDAKGYSDRFWTLDPIDGTKGFLRKQQYAIALALVEQGEVVVGALACPNLPYEDGGAEGTLFCAVRGEGTRMQPLFTQAEGRVVRVSATGAAEASRFCESVESGHSKHDDSAEVASRLGIHNPPLRIDSQCKYGVVARGEAEIYLRLPTRADYREKIWDHAAGALVVSEAGGTVTDVEGRPLDFKRGSTLAQNRGVVVTNGPLHERIIGILRDLGI